MFKPKGNFELKITPIDGIPDNRVFAGEWEQFKQSNGKLTHYYSLHQYNGGLIKKNIKENTLYIYDKMDFTPCFRSSDCMWILRKPEGCMITPYIYYNLEQGFTLKEIFFLFSL